MHFIDHSYKRQFAVAGCVSIEGAHNSDNFFDMIEQTLNKVAVSKKQIHLVLRDAAKVMKATTRKINIDSCDCFLHKIQLAIKDGIDLEEIEEKFATIRSLITHYNKSSNFRKVLATWQKHFGLRETVLLQVIYIFKMLYFCYRMSQQDGIRNLTC